MFAALLIALVQAATPLDAPAPDAVPATQETSNSEAPSGRMACEPFDRRSQSQTCTTAEGEVLRCRRETVLGSRFPTTVCLTYREDQRQNEDTRRNLDRQQRLWDNQGG